MIDQRVSEGIDSKFFGIDAFTTTIPAQFVKKFEFWILQIPNRYIWFDGFYLNRIHIWKKFDAFDQMKYFDLILFEKFDEAK